MKWIMLNVINKILPVLQGIKKGVNPLNVLKPSKDKAHINNDQSPVYYKTMLITTILMLVIISFSFVLVLYGLMNVETFKKIVNKILFLIGVEQW
jgi:hypothetical protein